MVVDPVVDSRISGSSPTTSSLPKEPQCPPPNLAAAAGASLSTLLAALPRALGIRPRPCGTPARAPAWAMPCLALERARRACSRPPSRSPTAPASCSCFELLLLSLPVPPASSAARPTPAAAAWPSSRHAL
nr:uncharacterized protein LOC120970254 [Aegilops tauschii subsp. strangulata]